MKRHPKHGPTPEVTRVPPNAFGPRVPTAQAQPDRIEPFLVSGGQPYYDIIADVFNPSEDAVQLLGYAYVPQGRIGFCKQLRVAPYMPASLSDPWETSGAENGSATWRNLSRLSSGMTGSGGAAGTNGVWTTPMGWRSYWSTVDGSEPTWHWSLRYVQGDIQKLRSQRTNVPEFDPLVPESWYLVPDVPVPASAYPSGLPGTSVGPTFSDQRVQVLQGDELTMHIPIPQDTSLVLFARWTQNAYVQLAADFNGSILVDGSGTVMPLLPSFGQMLGYTQSLTSEAAAYNLGKGWGG